MTPLNYSYESFAETFRPYLKPIYASLTLLTVQTLFVAWVLFISVVYLPSFFSGDLDNALVWFAFETGLLVGGFATITELAILRFFPFMTDSMLTHKAHARCVRWGLIQP